MQQLTFEEWYALVEDDILSDLFNNDWEKGKYLEGIMRICWNESRQNMRTRDI